MLYHLEFVVIQPQFLQNQRISLDHLGRCETQGKKRSVSVVFNYMLN